MFPIGVGLFYIYVSCRIVHLNKKRRLCENQKRIGYDDSVQQTVPIIFYVDL